MARSTYTPSQKLPSRGVIGARVRNTAVQAIATATITPITFDTASYNPVGMWSATTNPTRITALVGGWYVITGNIYWASPGGAVALIVRIRLNAASNIAYAEMTTDSAWGVCVTTTYQLAKADYVELTAFQASGLSINTTVSSLATPSLAVHYLGY